MYMVEIRKFGRMVKTFQNLDDANLCLLQNGEYNAILCEAMEFPYNGKKYLDSFSNDHKIHAILNSEYRFLCKYDSEKTTKENALENYLSNDNLIF